MVSNRSLDSRMTQEVLRKHVLRVLRVWREHYLFNDDYLNGLQVGPGPGWQFVYLTAHWWQGCASGCYSVQGNGVSGRSPGRQIFSIRPTGGSSKFKSSLSNFAEPPIPLYFPTGVSL